jgi:hypothetical protein
VERSFAPTDGGRDRITLRLWDPTSRSGAALTIAMLREIARSQSPFDASAVAPRAFGWRQPAGGKRETFVVFRPHGAWIIQAMYTAAAARPRAAVARTLRQVVREQLERPAPAPARFRIPPVARYLDELLLSAPSSGGRSFVRIPSLSGLVDREWARRTADPAGAAALLAEDVRIVARVWGSPADGTRVAVMLGDAGSDGRAAAILHNQSRFGVLDADADTVTTSDSRGRRISIAARQGQFVVLVAAAAEEGGQSIAARALAAQRRRLPDGATSPRSWSVTDNVLSLFGSILMLLLAFAGVRLFVIRVMRTTVRVPPAGGLPRDRRVSATRAGMRLRAAGVVVLVVDWCLPFLGVDVPAGAWLPYALLVLVLSLPFVPRLIERARHRRGSVQPRPPRPVPVESVTSEALHLRNTGVVLGLVLLAIVAAGLSLVFYSPPAATALLCAAATIVLLKRRRERGRRGVALMLGRRRLLPSVVIALISVAAAAVALGATVLLAGSTALDDSLAESDVRRQGGSGAGTGTALMLYAVTTSVVAVLGFRLARYTARLRADELRKVDKRRQVLYLRGFADDKLKIPTIVSGRRPLLELLSPFPNERYEAIVGWSLDRAGPTVSIAAPEARMGSLGAARARVGPAEDWRDVVTGEMEASGVIAISLGRTPGLQWELWRLVERGLLDRVMILFPPVTEYELRGRWQAVAPMFGAHSLPLDPASTLVVTFDEGRLCAITADRRDEAGYRAAIAHALPRIVDP